MTELQVAQASTLVALLLGLSGVAVSIWQTFASRTRDRWARYEDRRADAYIQVLRHVEARGQAVQDTIANVTSDEHREETYLPRVEVAEPERTTIAEAAALVAAFGSRDLKAAMLSWTDALRGCEHQMQRSRFDWYEEHTHPLPGHFENVLALELGTRGVVGDVVGSEIAGPGRRRQILLASSR